MDVNPIDVLTLICSTIPVTLTTILLAWQAIDKASFKKFIKLIKEYFQNWLKTQNSQKIESKVITSDSEVEGVFNETKVQEIISFPSSMYSNWLSKINSKKTVILSFVNGIIATLSVLSVIALIRYININGIEEILNSLQFSYEKEPTQSTLSGGGLNIIYLFWMYVILFGIIGAVRGWAKELLVIFSAVTALAVILLLEKYISLFRDLDKVSISVFWMRIIIFAELIYFGYQAINFSRFVPKSNNEKLQDSLVGSILGGINGYLIAGTVLYFNHVGNYPYNNILSRALDPTVIEKVERMMVAMPPRYLGEPGIYFAVIIILIFIVVVYI